MRPARCTCANGIYFGAVISLSEGGCLFRSFSEPPASKTRLLFTLPPNHRIEVRARMVRREGHRVALRFPETSPDVRSAIGRYVMDELLSN